jgi:hypothetical protein
MSNESSEVQARIALRMERLASVRKEYFAAARRREAAGSKRDEAVAKADAKLAAFDEAVNATIRRIADELGSAAGAAAWLELSEAAVKRAMTVTTPIRPSRPKPKVEAPPAEPAGQMTLDDLSNSADDARGVES